MIRLHYLDNEQTYSDIIGKSELDNDTEFIENVLSVDDLATGKTYKNEEAKTYIKNLQKINTG